MVVNTEPRNMRMLMVPLHKIHAAPWNPKDRVEKRRLKNLMASIEDIGLIYPVVLDEKNNLVDGHRRHAVAGLLGWHAIPAIYTSSEFLHAYGSLQANQERLNGNDLIGVYLVNPKALIYRQLHKIGRVEDACGGGILKKLYKAGMTAGTFDIAMRIVRYTSEGVTPLETTEWLIDHRMGAQVRHLLEGGIPKSKFVNAIKNDQPIKVKLTAE